MSHIRTTSDSKSKQVLTNTGNLSNYLDNFASKYLEVLRDDIATNEREQSKLNMEITTIRELMGHLKGLSESPEWPNSFIQVNSLAYIPATIIHTGEHYVKLGSEIYSLMSLKETLDFLHRKVNRAQETLNTFKLQLQQLHDRCKFYTETSSETADETGNMPAAISSAKGTAHKTSAGFYEVIEPYVEDEERAFYKRRLKHKSKKNKSKEDHAEEADTYFRRLEELQKQENLRRELVNIENYKKPSGNDCIISERVRTILRNCGIYRHLLEDDVIQQHYENFVEVGDTSSITALNERVLDELIVKTLINEPVVYSLNNVVIPDANINSEIRDIPENNSSNDLAVTAFLDEIERDMQNWDI